MSIYSGFATRKIQQNYNNLLSKLISFLQQHVIQFMSLIQCGNSTQIKKSFLPENNFIKYRFILTKMKQYEEHKYLQPKFSQICSLLKKVVDDLFTLQKEDNEKSHLSLGLTPKLNTDRISMDKEQQSLNKKNLQKDYSQFKRKSSESVAIPQLRNKQNKKSNNRQQNSPFRKYIPTSFKTSMVDLQLNKKLLSCLKPQSIGVKRCDDPTNYNKIKIHRSFDRKNSDCEQPSQFQVQEQVITYKRSILPTRASNTRHQCRSYQMSTVMQQRQQQQTKSTYQKQTQKQFILLSSSRTKHKIYTPSNIKPSRNKRALNRTLFKKSLIQDEQGNDEKFGEFSCQP